MSIYKKIPAIMAEVGHIEKSRKNTQGSGYNFRGIDDVYLAMQPLLAKHGVFYSPVVESETREERTSKSGGMLIYTVLRVRFNFFADDGSTFPAVTVGEAMDSGDKSSNKAMSAALKYALLQVFCIPTQEDNDTENNSPDPLPKDPSSIVSVPKTGIVALQAVSDDISEPGSYIIRCNPHKDKRLDQVGQHDLNSWVQKWKGKQISGVLAEAISEASKYLDFVERKIKKGEI